jgi:UDP-N-acetylmuramoyl-L-alanyl-D-glutamate--2,6-diaminopimelate ligase
MRMADLVATLPGAALTVGSPDLEIFGVEVDSRGVGPGMLFCCIPGSTDDGHRHAAAAQAAGAVAVLTEHDLPEGLLAGVAEIRVPKGAARSAAAMASAEVLGRPADRLTMVGVTGTNGKTTVVQLVSEILASTGSSVKTIGTLTGERTTPGAPELHRLFATAESDAVRAGRPGAVAMEVSSHALDQQRTEGVAFDVAVFTNLSHDHLDYHGTMEAYFEAKAKLFDDRVARTAVIWAETDYGRRLLATRSGPTVAVTLDDAVDLDLGPRGSSFVWRGQQVEIRILGRNGVIDALLAAEAALALGHDPREVADGLSKAAGVPGRMELVAGPAGTPTVVVDYAHTPDALASALIEMRRLAHGGRVSVVFGCGGDRDRSKRPLMGAAAVAGADAIVVTADNPRSEDPKDIADAVVAGMHGADVVVELDRASAIATAIRASGSGDLVLIAGKGHEVTQIVGDSVRDFDDRSVASAVLRAMGQGGASTC